MITQEIRKPKGTLSLKVLYQIRKNNYSPTKYLSFMWCKETIDNMIAEREMVHSLPPAKRPKT